MRRSGLTRAAAAPWRGGHRHHRNSGRLLRHCDEDETISTGRSARGMVSSGWINRSEVDEVRQIAAGTGIGRVERGGWMAPLAD